eukprot:2971032-Rhodomonas_salina.1
MSGYSAGFPPDVFETALQHARPHVGYHLVDLWVRFTEARMTVLHARAVSSAHAREIDELLTALADAPTSAW